MFANLHTHTDYSVLDGMMTVGKAFEKAKQNNYSALAITEHANLSSLYIALQAAEKYELKFIPGIEFNFADDTSDEKGYHLVALATNHSGLLSIMRVSYRAYFRDYKFPYITWEDLDLLDRNGVYILSGCEEGLLARKTLFFGPQRGGQIVDRFSSMFGDRFFVELIAPYNDRQNDINGILLNLAKQKGVATVMTLDSHYADEVDAELFPVFQAIQSKRTIFDRDKFYDRAPLITEETLRSMCGAEFSSSIDHAAILADKCEDSKNYLPKASEFLMPKFNVQEADNYEAFKEWRKKTYGA
jgi:DNA polymerase-3 subunit alpha